MSNSQQSVIEEQVKNLLQAIDPNIEYSMEVTVADTDAQVHLTGSGLGKLIGFRGKNLYALESIITLMIIKQEEEYQAMRVYLDVNQYKEKRIDQLKSLAQRVSDRVLREHTPISLSPMNNSERKVIHMAVLEIEGVRSESIGEGRERLVIISPE